MKAILLHRSYDEAHLAAVKAEMENRGAPELRGVWMECWGAWVALEGCHRLRAAHALGIEPEWIEVEYSSLPVAEVIPDSDLDDYHTVESVCDSATDRDRVMLTWEE